MRYKIMKKNSKAVKDFNKGDYVTTGQACKILGISKYFILKEVQYINIDRIKTPYGLLWNRYELYKHLIPKASDDLISQAILDDREKIRIRQYKEKRGVKKDV